jgi:hypothetical protein
MPTLVEGKLSCTFPPEWDATKYDDWAFYRNQFVNCCGGNKAVDFLAYDLPSRTLWLIELKDYRQSQRTKGISLWDEVSIKARDTLSGLFAAKVEAGHHDQPFARQSLKAKKLRVVLHLEQPATNSKLFPRAFAPADVQQKLKQFIKPIDAHPRVVQLSNMTAVPWAASSVP